MIIYQAPVEKFNEDVMQNCLADKAAEKYRAHYKRSPGDREYRSWQQSFPVLKHAFDYAGLKDVQVVIEYELPYSSQRIDILLFGTSREQKENVVILELKQWSNDRVKEVAAEGNVLVDYGQFKKEQAHPSLQVQGYYFHLRDFVKIFDEKKSPQLSAASYVFNYSKNGEAKALFSDKYKSLLEQFPIFAKEDARIMGEYLKEKLGTGGGQALYDRFLYSPIAPSKKLLEHTSDMINKQQIFNLIDEQIAAYNGVMYRAKRLAKTKKKSVVIVKGGPGTGKSVIALEVMGELLRQGKTVMHATGSSAFTNTIRKIVGVRSRNLFKFFNSFPAEKKSSFDVLVCDEAHRIRESSVDRYTSKADRSDMFQIDELLKTARLNIFFIDEHQVVRPKEVGTVALIKEAATRYNISEKDVVEFELQTQFRCSGSDVYLKWLDHVLGIQKMETLDFDSKMQFRIFDNPTAMMKQIRKHNIEKINSARIVAGYCWPWSRPNADGSLVNDVKIGSFEMSWEPNDATRFWKWATDNSGMEQVGTVYTSQGMEFDYIAVIFGNDLVYDPATQSWKAVPQNSYDSQAKAKNPELVRHLKNVYRVLMSRAHKGVYVYFVDKNTEKYFKRMLALVNKK